MWGVVPRLIRATDISALRGVFEQWGGGAECVVYEERFDHYHAVLVGFYARVCLTGSKGLASWAVCLVDGRSWRICSARSCTERNAREMGMGCRM